LPARNESRLNTRSTKEGLGLRFAGEQATILPSSDNGRWHEQEQATPSFSLYDLTRGFALRTCVPVNRCLAMLASVLSPGIRYRRFGYPSRYADFGD